MSVVILHEILIIFLFISPCMFIALVLTLHAVSSVEDPQQNVNLN